MKMAREKLGRPCDMCSNYETQLQTVQEELKKEKCDRAKVERHLMTERHVTSNLTKYVGELESALRDAADDTLKQVGVCGSRARSKSGKGQWKTLPGNVLSNRWVCVEHGPAQNRGEVTEKRFLLTRRHSQTGGCV